MFILAGFLSTIPLQAYSSDMPLVPDRRKAQFQDLPGYFVVPFPYSYEGIGQGLMLGGSMSNIGGSYTDVYGVGIVGDIKGWVAGVTEVHLIPRTLIIEAGSTNISRATFKNYSMRGMNTDKNDYTILEMKDDSANGGRLTATFFDRRVEFYALNYWYSLQANRILDKDGNVIYEAKDPQRLRGESRTLGVRLDLTDDYSDPRRGFRFDVSRDHSPPDDTFSADYYVMDYNATAYVPIGRRSTWLLNYFWSDAHVTRQGETSVAGVEQKTGLFCETITNPLERADCEKIINNYIDANKYGTASQLGGDSRLRSYSFGRYMGAHTMFYGTEIRWNFTDEYTPYDIWFMKDVRTAVQAALFYEVGSVADNRDELGDIKRSSYGIGARVVTASGIVFRADFAWGREGFAPVLTIFYPWEIY
jgi:hypothetical protein